MPTDPIFRICGDLNVNPRICWPMSRDNWKLIVEDSKELSLVVDNEDQEFFTTQYASLDEAHSAITRANGMINWFLPPQSDSPKYVGRLGRFIFDELFEMMIGPEGRIRKECKPHLHLPSLSADLNVTGAGDIGVATFRLSMSPDRLLLPVMHGMRRAEFSIAADRFILRLVLDKDNVQSYPNMTLSHKDRWDALRREFRNSTEDILYRRFEPRKIAETIANFLLEQDYYGHPNFWNLKA